MLTRPSSVDQTTVARPSDPVATSTSTGCGSVNRRAAVKVALGVVVSMTTLGTDAAAEDQTRTASPAGVARRASVAPFVGLSAVSARATAARKRLEPAVSTAVLMCGVPAGPPSLSCCVAQATYTRPLAVTAARMSVAVPFAVGPRSWTDPKPCPARRTRASRRPSRA